MAKFKKSMDLYTHTVSLAVAGEVVKIWLIKVACVAMRALRYFAKHHTISKPKYAQYEITDNGMAITHLKCGMKSHNQKDVEHRFCGFCHVFMDEGEATTHSRKSAPDGYPDRSKGAHAMTPEEKRDAVNALSMGLLDQCRIIAEERGFVNSHYRKKKDGTLVYKFILREEEKL